MNSLNFLRAFIENAYDDCAVSREFNICNGLRVIKRACNFGDGNISEAAKRIMRIVKSRWQDIS
jgi:hypothetical protein